MFPQIIDLYHQEFSLDKNCAEHIKERLKGVPLCTFPTKKYAEDFRALLCEAMGVSLWQKERKENPLIQIRQEERQDGQTLKYFLRLFHDELQGSGFPRKIDYKQCLVAEERKSEKLVGASWYNYNQTLAGRNIFIERLYIRQEERRKGYAESLLEEIVEQEKSFCEGIQLVAPESSLPFYSSLGFRRIGKTHSDGKQNFSLLYIAI